MSNSVSHFNAHALNGHLAHSASSKHARHSSHPHGTEHTVRRNEDLAALAAAYGVTPQAIVAANRHLIVDPSLPLVQGDRLRIPEARSASVLAQSERPEASASTTSNNYRRTLTLQRQGHAAPPQSAELKRVVDGLNGYMRKDHPELGNRNRIVHERGPKAGEEIEFPAKRGVRMVDGNGEFRGTLAADAVKINYGQRKQIVYTNARGETSKETYVYAFATSIHTNGKKVGASGWIPLSGLKESTAKTRYAADLRAVVEQGPRGGDAPQQFHITRGDTSKYGDLKVNPGSHGRGVDRKDNLAATDYLGRPGGVVNLLYSLPGHGGASTDTFKTGATFVPAAGVPRVRIPLYLPKNPTSAERAAWRNNEIPHYMEFVYGRVAGAQGEDRYGWIAADALKPKAT